MLVDRPVAALLASPVADLLGERLRIGRRLDAQRREQARLLHVVEHQALLGGGTEQLALEPLQLTLDVGELFGEVGDRRAQSRVLLLQNLDPGMGQGVRTRRRDARIILDPPRSCRPPVALALAAHLDVGALQQRQQPRAGQRQRAGGGAAQRGETPLLQALRPDPVAPGVERQHLQHRAPAVHEHVPVPVGRVRAQLVAYQRRKPVEGTAHVARRRVQPDAAIPAQVQHRDTTPHTQDHAVAQVQLRLPRRRRRRGIRQLHEPRRAVGRALRRRAPKLALPQRKRARRQLLRRAKLLARLPAALVPRHDRPPLLRRAPNRHPLCLFHRVILLRHEMTKEKTQVRTETMTAQIARLQLY